MIETFEKKVFLSKDFDCGNMNRNRSNQRNATLKWNKPAFSSWRSDASITLSMDYSQMASFSANSPSYSVLLHSVLSLNLKLVQNSIN